MTRTSSGDTFEHLYAMYHHHSSSVIIDSRLRVVGCPMSSLENLSPAFLSLGLRCIEERILIVGSWSFLGTVHYCSGLLQVTAVKSVPSILT